MSDVEKSLQQVYSRSLQYQYQSTGVINDRNRSDSVSPFPRSPSFHFPPTTLVKKNKEKKYENNNNDLSLTLPENYDNDNHEERVFEINPSVELDCNYNRNEGKRNYYYYNYSNIVRFVLLSFLFFCYIILYCLLH